MRIHTNLTEAQFRDAIRNSGAPVITNKLTEHKSASHARAFKLRLGGSVPSRTNAGTRYAGDEQSATWDEWGAVMGAIYAADPDARMGGTSKRPTYGNADHFHFQTGDRFRGRVELNRPAVTADAPTTYLPADTHPRHRWVYQGKTPALAIVHECSECSAITRRADFDTFASKIGA